jgi:hypothetical protein
VSALIETNVALVCLRRLTILFDRHWSVARISIADKELLVEAHLFHLGLYWRGYSTECPRVNAMTDRMASAKQNKASATYVH